MTAYTKTYPTDLASLVRKPLKIEAELIRLTPTNEELLQKQLLQNNRIEKEQEIVQKQLLLPPELQNKELLEKYKLSTNNAVVNGYKPDSDSRGIPLFYHYRCYFPTDPEIVYEHRPVDNYNMTITDIFSTRGDKFTFFFPVARSSLGGKIAYQLDNFNTFLDEQGDVILDEGIFDIFPALILFKEKNTEYEQKILDVFYRYDIIEPSGHPGGLYSNTAKLDFKIKNKNLSVVATPINMIVPKEKDEKVVLTEQVKRKIIEKENQIDKKTFLHFIKDNEIQVMHPGNQKTHLENIYSNSMSVLKQFRLFNSVDKQGLVNYSIVNGTIPGVTYATLEDSVADHNTDFLIFSDKGKTSKFKMKNKTLLKVIQVKSGASLE